LRAGIPTKEEEEEEEEEKKRERFKIETLSF
jgi:hypothetical protein